MKQVFMFDCEKPITAYKWQGTFNSLLPGDIHIVECEEVDNKLFHARYNVRWKKYTYRINMGDYNVLQKDYVYQLCKKLDIELMKEASNYLLGEHDFTSFNSTSLEECSDQVRTIRSIEFNIKDDILAITYQGKGFLRYMVRMMSQALIEIGLHEYPITYIKEMLDAKSKSFPHRNAPANGLVLDEVNYFEVIALDEVLNIREFIIGDKTPKEMSVLDIENDYSNNGCLKYYNITYRKGQNSIGYLNVEDGILYVNLYNEDDKKYFLEIVNQVETWMKKYSIMSWQFV